ncbi:MULTISPECIES: ABC transporter substrate-binding protein [unclassified Thermotoga]|uniref:ABC transporter substrate-binding protein n=1 Tax=unclassified Thermotoga TaxID=2631113 RepID=UPI000280E8FB|nr:MULTISPECIES: ABC transporter substrate-binding protein [unclassified Thermotoga]AIY86057.1 extracellular solute-binding protein [Thermotoga sp. 2812B]EJX27035.1 extracellular solute-binding protein [Thermotoga sp. EMP]
MSRLLVLLVVLGLLSVGLSAELIGLKAVKPGEYYNLTDYEALTGKKITEFHESPMLSELAKQGKLPPVEQRLPKNPVVLVPWEKPGKYGGIMRRVWLGPSDFWNIGRLMMEGLVLADNTGAAYLPCILESLQTEDNKVFVAKIREGLKWSDGVEVTTEDFRCWYEDLVLGGALKGLVGAGIGTLVPPTLVGCKIEIVDKYTLKFIFEKPNPLFPMYLTDIVYSNVMVPAHYVKNFLPKYVGEEKIQKLAKEAGYTDWTQYLVDYYVGVTAFVRNPDLPVLLPWKLSKESTDELAIFERNPYYFKVDTEGNQLPYIDKIYEYRMQSYDETFLLKLISGEVDFQLRGIKFDWYTVLAANEDKGHYKVLLTKTTRGAETALFFNQNYQGDDEYMRELLRNVKFRQALSLAINREEIWQLVYSGFGKPRQASLVEGLQGYDPEWEKAYAEYDPDRANKLLDEIGLDKRDSEGWRLRPDGKRVEIVIEFVPPGTDKELELMKSHIEKVGVKVLLQPRERSLYFARLNSGQPQVVAWVFGGPFFLCIDLKGGKWAPLYYQWYAGGKKGGVAPEEGSVYWRLYELWDQVTTEVDPERREMLIKEIVNIFKENLWFIGAVGQVPIPGVVNEKMQNVPRHCLWNFNLFKTPRNFRPEQFYYEE